MSSTSGGLRKSGGCDGCPDASAVSEQQISSTGTLTFVASESASLRFVGLAAGGIGTGPGDINFALRLQSGVAEVREAGTYKSDVRFAAGDTFAIAISSGVVKYSKNGSVSTRARSAPIALCALTRVFLSQCSRNKCRTLRCCHVGTGRACGRRLDDVWHSIRYPAARGLGPSPATLVQTYVPT